MQMAAITVFSVVILLIHKPSAHRSPTCVLEHSYLFQFRATRYILPPEDRDVMQPWQVGPLVLSCKTVHNTGCTICTISGHLLAVLRGSFLQLYGSRVLMKFSGPAKPWLC